MAELETACRAAGFSLCDDPRVLGSVLQVLPFSRFVAERCRQNPEMLHEMVSGGELFKRLSPEDYRRRIGAPTSQVRDEQDLARRLRRMRNREMVRIAWRDLASWAELDDTMAELSALADACLQAALTHHYGWLCERHGTPLNAAGQPQQLVVVGLGKLGARELNFSSDIDLMLAFPETGATSGGQGPGLDNEAFFSLLGRSLIRAIGQPSGDGFVFRVDLRLRPFGDSGPLAMSFDAMEAYYQQQGREWERYALIKARVVAGDRVQGRSLLQRLHPFIYRRFLDYGAFESLRDMKTRISLEVRRRDLAHNIKLGPGGIREVEFFGQVFQLIRGGVQPTLQRRRIRVVLARLVSEKLIPATVAGELDAAYRFLRTTEHRLQQWEDAQTHMLPSTPDERARLAASMGFADRDAFLEALEHHRHCVHGHFTLLLAEEGTDTAGSGTDKALADIWANPGDGVEGHTALRQIGFRQPAAVTVQLDYLRHHTETRMLSATGRTRLDRLVPMLLKAAGTSPEPEACLGRIVELVRTVQRRTCYLSLLLENPGTLEHLVRLASASPWIVTFLSRHPVLLDELLDPRSLYAPPIRSERLQDLRRRLEGIPLEEQEFLNETLSVFKQVNTLRVAAADVTGALPLMRTSDHLTEIAEIVLEEVLEMAWRYLSGRYGTPTCRLGPEPIGRGFAIVAYGKLGGIELGYASDLDLVFLHAGREGNTTGGTRSLDNAQFFARLGQRVVHLLTAHTRAGVLYEIDMRLRPSGAAGILVSHVESFRDYQRQSAWTWEHQALVRARGVAGDTGIVKRFEQIRREVLTLPREGRSLREEVGQMRERMRQEHLHVEKGLFDLKQGKGGIVDIEFLVQYLVLLHAHAWPRLAAWTDNVRLLDTLAASGVLTSEDTRLLRDAYLAYRAAAHRLSLQEKPARVPDQRFVDHREAVGRLYEATLTLP